MSKNIEANHRTWLNSPRLSRWNKIVIYWFSGPWLPTIIFLGAYAATTVFGATYFLTDAGQIDLKRFLGSLDPTVAAVIGSPVYLTLLFLPFVVVPIFAYVGIAATRYLTAQIQLPRQLLEPDLSRTALWVLALASCFYCLQRLYVVDALLPDLLLDQSATYRDRIIERTRLFDSLGPVFFIICYGIIPIISTIFLTLFNKKGRNIPDFFGFLLTFIFFYLFIFHIYSKSHILVFSLMLASSILISRASLWYIPALAVISVCAFLTMEVALSGVGATTKPAKPMDTQAAAEITASTDEGASKGSKEGVPQGSRENAPQRSKEGAPKDSKDGVSSDPGPSIQSHILYYVGTATLLRMASAFPFYVAVFDDPAERCGIEANTVRRVLGFPHSECSLPTKIFPVMYPEIHWVTGYAPAPAHVSAYGEIGLAWSMAVMALSGLCLGILGKITRMGTGPLFVAIGVASCTYAYYLSQLPFVATFTYGHGLAFLMLPIVALIAVSLFRNRLTGRYSQAER